MKVIHLGNGAIAYEPEATDAVRRITGDDSRRFGAGDARTAIFPARRDPSDEIPPPPLAGKEKV